MASSTLTPQHSIIVKNMGRDGATLKAIAAAIDNRVGKARIGQLLKIYGISPIKVRRAAREKSVHAKFIKKWGVEPSDTATRQSIIYKRMRLKFTIKKNNCKRSGIAFDICFSDVVFPDLCPVFNLPLEYFKPEQHEMSPSFDRVNPRLGYIKGNVKIISARANRIKNDGLMDEHLKIAKYMEKNLPN